MPDSASSEADEKPSVFEQKLDAACKEIQVKEYTWTLDEIKEKVVFQLMEYYLTGDVTKVPSQGDLRLHFIKNEHDRSVIEQFRDRFASKESFLTLYNPLQKNKAKLARVIEEAIDQDEEHPGATARFYMDRVLVTYYLTGDVGCLTRGDEKAGQGNLRALFIGKKAFSRSLIETVFSEDFLTRLQQHSPDLHRQLLDFIDKKHELNIAIYKYVESKPNTDIRKAKVMVQKLLVGHYKGNSWENVHFTQKEQDDLEIKRKLGDEQQRLSLIQLRYPKACPIARILPQEEANDSAEEENSSNGSPKGSDTPPTFHNEPPLPDFELIAPSDSSSEEDVVTESSEASESVEVCAKPVKTGAKPTTLPLTRQFYQYFCMTNAQGRTHLFEVKAENFSPLNSEYQNCKGDRLKSKILDDMRNKLEAVGTLSELDSLVRDLKRSEEYRVLCTSQGISRFFGSFFGVETSSKEAFDKMVASKQAMLVGQARDTGNCCS